MKTKHLGITLEQFHPWVFISNGSKSDSSKLCAPLIHSQHSEGENSTNIY